MKKLFNILFIIAVYIVLCSRSCDDDADRTAGQESGIAAEKESIRLEFGSDGLSEEACFAAQMKAVQDLKDLSDYLEIFTDKSNDSLFRRKAGEMIRAMFISDEAWLSFGNVKNKKMKSGTLEEFLKKGFGDDVEKAAVIFDSIWVQQPLQKTDGSTYAGKLAALQTIDLHPSGGTVLSFSMPVSIHFISSKQAKIIGTDTLMVREVSFTGMD